jgi:hypothetical protein
VPTYLARLRPSVPLSAMTETHSNEVERVLLFISDAQERARRTAARLESEGAPEHVVGALRTAQEELEDARRRLMQGTFYAVSDGASQLTL